MRPSPAAIAVEDQLLAFLRDQPLPVSTSTVREWLESSGIRCPGRNQNYWWNNDVTARLKRLERYGLVHRLVFPKLANQEGHYWEAVV